MKAKSEKNRDLVILPAVDVRNGRAVRINSGELKTEVQFGDPIEVAKGFESSGAEWVHLVDLDAAFGTGSNYELLRRVIANLDLKVELSGGITDEASLSRALATGCERVNLGTAALENLEWTITAISRYADRIAVGLDVRGRTLSSRGMRKDVGELFSTISRLDSEGCQRYVVTDVERDGSLQGPNFELLESVCAITNAPVIASGGISSLDDLRRLRERMSIGIEGAIVGKALYSGALTLENALEISRGERFAD